MLRRSRLFFASLALSALVSHAGAARAQTVTPNNGGLTDRLDSSGNVITQNERPQNLNPTGVSYSDCVANQKIRFYIALSGFTGVQGYQVWAGPTDCSGDTARGKMGTPPVCWQLAGGVPALPVTTTTSTNVDVRVQDLVGPQNSIPPSGAVVSRGSEACTSQPSYSAVGMNVWFVPVDASGYAAGTAASFPVGTDLIGPPAPYMAPNSQQVGDTLFTVNWTPNVDPDTVGYDVYIDPTQSQVAAAMADGAAHDATSSLAEGGTIDATVGASSSGGISDSGFIVVCTGGEASVADATSADGEADDGSSDGATAAGVSTTPVVCHNQAAPAAATASALDAGSCGSQVLAQAFLSEGGAGETVVLDSGDDGGATTVSAVGGGVSTIPTANLINANGTTSITIASESVGTYQITGLTNGQVYNVAVSAVDAYGNIGPPSGQVCDFPAPVNDFYKTYRLDGGGAGGGFCTLEAVGMPTGLSGLAMAFGAIGFGLVRRRRKRNAPPG